MNASHEAVAKYMTQYYLTVTSDYGDPKGEEWYDANTTATFSVTSPVGMLVQQVFVSWSGNSLLPTTTGTITMNSPKMVTANWRTDYTQLLLLIIVLIFVGALIILLTRRRKRKKKESS